MKTTPILLATGNRDKQDEFRRLFQGLPFSPVTPAEAGTNADPEEEGETHEAIARDKAGQWSASASMLSIASDGGLVIPALGSFWESRYTHRFAGPVADNGERLARLLELMQPYQGEDRRASWVEALAIADRGRVLVSWACGCRRLACGRIGPSATWTGRLPLGLSRSFGCSVYGASRSSGPPTAS